MSLSFGILGFLNYGPMSGYDIVKAFESSLQFFWHVQNSHIYLELKKLEKQGYICGKIVIQSDRPNKGFLSITETGKKEFMNWLAEGSGEDATHFKSAFLMKVFFNGNMPPGCFCWQQYPILHIISVSAYLLFLSRQRCLTRPE